MRVNRNDLLNNSPVSFKREWGKLELLGSFKATRKLMLQSWCLYDLPIYLVIFFLLFKEPMLSVAALWIKGFNKKQ